MVKIGGLQQRWEKDRTYRALGKVFPNQGIVRYELKAAFPITADCWTRKQD